MRTVWMENIKILPFLDVLPVIRIVRHVMDCPLSAKPVNKPQISNIFMLRVIPNKLAWLNVFLECILIQLLIQLPALIA